LYQKIYVLGIVMLDIQITMEIRRNLKAGSIIEFTTPEVNGKWVNITGEVLGTDNGNVFVICDLSHKLIIDYEDIIRILKSKLLLPASTA